MRFIFILIFAFNILIANNFELSWYSWDGFSSYKKEKDNFLKNLKSTNRIFLSFTTKEIKLIKNDDKEKKKLKKFLADLNSMGIQVELLIGDPFFVYPKNHYKLLSIVETFSGFNFSGIQLDIEPYALRDFHEKKWVEDISTLLLRLDIYTNLPIGFSLNHNLAKPYILEKFKEVNLDEVVLMYYSVNIINLESKMRKLLNNNKNLKFSLALSIEPLSILAKEETFAPYGQISSKKIWKKMDSFLKKSDNFKGIVIQSLKYYNKVEL